MIKNLILNKFKLLRMSADIWKFNKSWPKPIGRALWTESQDMGQGIVVTALNH